MLIKPKACLLTAFKINQLFGSDGLPSHLGIRARVHLLAPVLLFESTTAHNHDNSLYSM